MTTSLGHPTQEWSSLQDVFYRKSEIYSLSWGIEELSDYIVASAKDGGLLALARNPNKLVSLGKAALLKPKIHVYTSAGQLVETLPWEASDRIIGFGFTSNEQLAVVLDEGDVRLYTLFSPCPSPPRSGSNGLASFDEIRPVEATSTSYYVQYSLGQEATDTGIVDVRMWPDGLIALTGGGSFVEWRFPIRNADSDFLDAPSHAQILPSLPNGTFASGSRPSAWNIVPPESTSSGLAHLLISPTSSNTIFSLDSVGGATDMRLSRGPFSAIAPSPNGNLLALMTADSVLWVVSSDFQRSLSEFDVKKCETFRQPVEGQTTNLKQIGIRQIEWCGNNTVAIAWDSEIVMVGPFGDSIRYFYAGTVEMVSELDGLRIVSSDRLEFIQKVAESSKSIFLPGSTHSSAILFDASEQYAKKSAKADEGIRAIRKDLSLAVDTCLEAASMEWDIQWQRKLMRAATFGKSFIDAFDPTILVDTARTLRILNAARRYDIGIPITEEQYRTIGAERLIKRLTNRNHHLLSLHITNYLFLRPDSVLKHWARGKIARSRSGARALAQGASANAADDETCRAIVAKFEMQPSVSYAEIARTAWNSGRPRLATKLLDHEPRAVDQVPLLLTMHEDKLALVKAIESGDTDLVYHVLLRLKSQLSRGDFFRSVQAPIADASAPASGLTTDGTMNVPSQSSHVYLASNLLEIYAKQEDVELLKDFYFQDDRRTEGALLALERAAKESDVTQKVQFIKEAQKLFGEEKERGLESKLSEEYVRLLGFQSAMEKEDGGRTRFVGLSVNETIRTCLIKDLPKKAEKVRVDWKVPDKRFWNIKISALISGRDTEGLWAFANSKKSPIGYQPFIAQLIGAGYVQESLRYVPKCLADKSDKSKLRSYLQRIPAPIANQLAERIGDA